MTSGMRALVCLWFVIVASGIPLPVGFRQESDKSAEDSHSITAKDQRRPFPCMFSRCGCQTAEQCWKSCCCHTMSYRLAWAKARGIEPPDYVLAELSPEELCAWQSEEVSSPAQGCCQSESNHTKPNPQTRRCCETKNKFVEDDVNTLPTTMVVQDRLRCQGQPWELLCLGCLLPLPAGADLVSDSLTVATISVVDPLWTSVTSPVDVPPPRA